MAASYSGDFTGNLTGYTLSTDTVTATTATIFNPKVPFHQTSVYPDPVTFFDDFYTLNITAGTTGSGDYVGVYTDLSSGAGHVVAVAYDSAEAHKVYSLTNAGSNDSNLIRTARWTTPATGTVRYETRVAISDADQPWLFAGLAYRPSGAMPSGVDGGYAGNYAISGCIGFFKHAGSTGLHFVAGSTTVSYAESVHEMSDGVYVTMGFDWALGSPVSVTPYINGVAKTGTAVSVDIMDASSDFYMVLEHQNSDSTANVVKMDYWKLQVPRA